MNVKSTGTEISPIHIVLVAGEASGDALGASLIPKLQKKYPGALFSGVGGIRMMEAGLKSIFPLETLSLMGILEVLPHIWALRQRLWDVVRHIEETKPLLVITIDAPGFNFRLCRILRKRQPSLRLIHYVAPSVWAWRPKRAKKIAKFLDRLLVLFPFEPPYFEKEGLTVTYMGHPLYEEAQSHPYDPTFRERYAIPKEAKIIVVLPGSRQSEINRLLPIFQENIERLKTEDHDIFPVYVTIPSLYPFLKSTVGSSALILENVKDKWALYDHTHAALAASGTITLELALKKIPMVVAYKMNALTYQIVRRLVSINYVCLVNILHKKPIVTECIQNQCRVEKIHEEMKRVIYNIEVRQQQIMALDKVREFLKPPASCEKGEEMEF